MDGVPVWALVNLILSVVGLVLAVLLVIWALFQRNKKQAKPQGGQRVDDESGKYMAQQSDDNYSDEVKKQKKRRTLWFLLSVILGVVGIVVFLFTEDLSRKMALVDSWTIVNAIILAVQIIAIVSAFKHKKHSTDNTEKPASSTPSNTQ